MWIGDTKSGADPLLLFMCVKSTEQASLNRPIYHEVICFVNRKYLIIKQ